MRRIRTIPVMLLLTLSMSGCYYDIAEELYPGSCDVSNVTWSATIEPIIQGRCATPACHSPGGQISSVDLTTYAGVKAKVDDGTFRTVVLVTRSMPAGSSLSACQLRRIDIWLDAGAPEN